MLIKKFIFTVCYIFTLISLSFSIEGYYFNEENNSFFLFESKNCYFSKFSDNNNLLNLNYDVSSDKITIFATPKGDIFIKIIDDERILCDNILYSGYYNKLNIVDFLNLQSDLTTDIDNKIDLISDSIKNFDENVTNEKKSQILTKKAILLNKKNAFDNAIIDFRDAIKLDPQNYEAFLNLSYSYIYKGDTKEALVVLTEATSLNNDANELIYFIKGGLNFLQGKNKEAVDDFNKTIEKSPDFVYAYNLRGSTYTNIGEYDNALKDYSKAIDLSSDYKESFVNRGNLYYKIGQFDNGRDDFDKIGVKEEENYYKIAFYYFKNEYFNKAKEYYDKAIANNENPDFYFNRSYCNFALNDFSLALEDIEKAISLKNSFYEYYNFRGIIYFSQKKYQEALIDFNKSIELEPNFFHPYIFRLFISSTISKEEYDKYLDLTLKNILYMKNKLETSILEYFCGLIDTSSLLYKITSENKELISVIYYYIGLKNQLKGFVFNAKTAYQIATDFKTKLYFTYYLSILYLKELDF
ncbi:MAG: hypothetical protein A2086_10210 [Spirochaetes bacterium GWD1_27_9]|nr:MAG: hypothetical protein A2Y34_18150 [Spirochaetes bacterium GWC1_27_15]OHD35870.1 MAG: hypothetical protein A2086_10210 [Spirochaetes bacterium GWD1_27_9]